MTTPVCTVDASGIHIPEFATVLSYLQTAYRGIYGSDVYLGNDSQDGQFIALLASAVHDANAMAAQVYNAYAPSTAQGTGLASIVKTNGITKKTPTSSTADLLIIGQAGAVIQNGIALDNLGYQWLLPAQVVIPLSGDITVTATCASLGAVPGSMGTINQIYTPTAGWQTVSNPADAAPGLPLESDATLRLRQSQSTQLPSQTVLNGMLGAILAIPNVSSAQAFENATDVTDSRGITPHAVALVVVGGDDNIIAQAILNKKSIGCNLLGTTIIGLTDPYGVPVTVNFYRPTGKHIKVEVKIKLLNGYTTLVATAIQQALSDWVKGLAPGTDVSIGRMYVPANMTPATGGNTFELKSLRIAPITGSFDVVDVPVTFHERALLSTADVSIVVVT